eukprot:CAMPEP_0177702976 /NCGR_PEP_ID=MMETSP0484_2-20121128/7426_1 /TAXON_ID=354590 /ORGANISM="Rhodomonas lens, Strain RHODO" /LENGTH=141 /DNA_ID=CAMNT_0019214301 /DNA_START=58 /DNA_END=480 /DNA_ORIENTATION=-
MAACGANAPACCIDTEGDGSGGPVGLGAAGLSGRWIGIWIRACGSQSPEPVPSGVGPSRFAAAAGEPEPRPELGAPSSSDRADPPWEICGPVELETEPGVPRSPEYGGGRPEVREAGASCDVWKARSPTPRCTIASSPRTA